MFRNASRSCRAALTRKHLLHGKAAFPPCLSMRNNAPVEHCVAEAFILHREKSTHDEGEFHFARVSHD